MDEPIDLTCDSDEEALQVAIAESLSGPGSGSGGGSRSGGGASLGSSSSSSSREIISNSPGSRVDVSNNSKRRRPQPSPPGERYGQGKRPRRKSEVDSGKLSAKSLLFRLLSTSPSDRASGVGSLSLEDLLSGDFQEALLCNYMIDMDFLVDVQPRLRSVPVVIVHGDKEGSGAEHNLRKQCARISPGIRLHGPQIPTYGTHHTKMMVLKFPTGVRVVVLTANFISLDVRGKSQGVWYQDFPLRKSETCDFEETLVDYLEKVGGPATTFGRTLKQYDFRSARVALVPSVPGTGRNQHKGDDLHKYGHMRVRALLSKEKVLLKEGGHKVVFQFSSLASLTDTPNQWLMELLTSFMAQDGQEQEKPGAMAGGGDLSASKLKDHLQLVWPSVEAVRTSTKGWDSGGTENLFGGRYQRPDMAKHRANDPRPELKPLLHKWEGNPAVYRARDAPHIKTYLRYREIPEENGQGTRVDGDAVAWCLLTSSNLSRSAWGFLDKKTSKQLALKSYEMGVMFLPSLFGNSSDDGPAFTCTPGSMGLTQLFPLTLSSACDLGRGLPLNLIPLPYRVPAPKYDFAKRGESDRPWVWDRTYNTPDHKNDTWPLPQHGDF